MQAAFVPALSSDGKPYFCIGPILHEDISKKILTDYSLSVSEIASLCGYENASYFARIFRSVTGLTPGEYRSQLQREIASPSSD